jgi:hypothetical protein
MILAISSDGPADPAAKIIKTDSRLYSENTSNINKIIPGQLILPAQQLSAKRVRSALCK